MNKLSGWDDTIVALATPPGISAIAVIRLSGDRSFEIIDSIFPAKDIFSQSSHTIHVGMIKDNDIFIDEVVLSLFKNPKSYTAEDIVEIGCHGSPFIQQQIINACIQRGARLARPGEFTQRAFLNGKLDLTQAEAVADLIASNTEASRKTALNNMRGGFSIRLKQMREQLITFAALIELELDFATEDVEFADREKFQILINEIDQATMLLIESFQLGNVIKNGVSVAIIGKPNAGKSTLLNTMLNEGRAIVSPIPGTTRDTIEEVVNINGILFRLIDTAGIRSHTSDLVEKLGIEKSLEKMNTADLVIYIFDINTDTAEEIEKQVAEFDKALIKYILVANKSDLRDEENSHKYFSSSEDLHLISAKKNVGIDRLKMALYNETVHATSVSDIVVTNTRHLESLIEIQRSLVEIKSGLGSKISGDLLSLDVRRCLYYLGEITGEVTNEDKLDYIFNKFCIGK